MGLDMYFRASRYLWQNPTDGDDAKMGRQIKEFFPELPKDVLIKTIEADFGYWRKANAIHNWFVKNVQNGVDDCGNYDVDRSQIKELLDIVTQILNDRSLAPTLLPTIDGFFFGATDYDEWYFKQLEYTKGMLEQALDPKMDEWDYVYYSSW